MADYNVKEISFGGNNYKMYPANLTSETQLNNASQDATETPGRIYPVRLDANGKLAVNVPWTSSGESDMTGATASTAGTHGLVPAPAAGDQDKVLKGDGTWDDNKFHVGDEYSFSAFGWPYGGSSGGKGAVYVILPKEIGSDVTKVTYTKTGTGTQGIKQDGSWLSNPSITGVSGFAEHHVTLEVSHSNITNNQTGIVLLTGFKLTFASA